MQSPFLLENESAYQAWRSRKLENYPTRLEQIAGRNQRPAQPDPG